MLIRTPKSGSDCGVKQTFSAYPVLQIRRGKSDNLGMIFYITSLKLML